MRILLVDADGDLLQGIRRELWVEHRQWEVLLAATGAEALAILARDPVDIVISDLLLPDMDGAEVLHRVRELQPGAVRIGTAAHPTAEWAEQAEGDLHRLFIKPFEPAFLRDALESLDIEDDEASVRAIRAFVGGLDRIPSMPSLYAELVVLLERETTGLADVTRLVQRDLGISAQVLRLANSVYCLSNRPVAEIGQAVAMVGVDTLRAVALFRGLITSFDQVKPQGLDLEKLWFHSLEVATGVRQLALLEGQSRLADLAFSVGLLHDLGLVVLATESSGRYQGLLTQAVQSRIPLAVLEQETFGVDHTQVGAHLLSLWGLPPAFWRPVREHHAPPLPGADFPLSAALHMADARHGGGAQAGIFADGRWGLHPHVLVDTERFIRWKMCLASGAGGG